MKKDLVLAGLLALAVALVPNTLQLIVSIFKLQGASIYWIICLLALGATSVAPILLGSKLPSQQESPKVRFGLPIALLLAGIASSAYFLAVVGLGKKGLGAGIGETLDSSLAPCFYALWACLSGKGNWSKNISIGLLLTVIGLLVIAPSHIAKSDVSGNSWLIVCGVIGAIGTSISLLIFRTLIRTYKASIGISVAIRYGGVSIAWFLVALFTGGIHDLQKIGYMPCIFSFLSGALLINMAYSAAVRIDSEAVVPAAMGLIPILALIIEIVLASSGLFDSTVSLKFSLLWIGITSVFFGIWFLQRDPATKVS